MSVAMSLTEKREIQNKLKIYVNTFTSQKKAAETLQNVSEATLIALMSHQEFGWDKISDAMWRNVANQVGGIVDFNRLVETQNFLTLTLYFDTAKDAGASFAIVGESGWGKTYAAKWYAAVNRKNNVLYLECAEYLTKNMFLSRLLSQCGKNSAGMPNGELMEALMREIRKMEKPIIILDEVDKLQDSVLKFFITLYNELNKICGFVWLSTYAIEKRVITGINLNKVGYRELFSRIGAQFITLNMPNRDEVTEICQVNGITEPERIAQVVNEVKDLKGDLRRVDRNILKYKIQSKHKNKKAA